MKSDEATEQAQLEGTRTEGGRSAKGPINSIQVWRDDITY